MDWVIIHLSFIYVVGREEKDYEGGLYSTWLFRKIKKVEGYKQGRREYNKY